MPTTTHEAEQIVDIAVRYVGSLPRVQQLFSELDEKVGRVSENDSVKQSFRMFRAQVDDVVIQAAYQGAIERGLEAGRLEAERRYYADTTEHLWHLPNWVWLTLFWLVTVFHGLLVLGNIASFCVAPFKAPWYLAFPACFAIIWVTFSSQYCAITEWENHVRARLGWRPIRSFIGHYGKKPVCIFLTRMGLLAERSVEYRIEEGTA